MNPVFFDPSGKRKFLAMGGVLLLLVVLATGGVGLFYGILTQPTIPALPPSIEALDEDLPINQDPVEQDQIPANAAQLRKNSVDSLRTEAKLTTQLVAAFYSWAPGRLQSLRANASKLTHLLPALLHISADGKELDFEDFDPTRDDLQEMMAIAKKNGLHVIPVLSNFAGDKFDPERMSKLLSSEDSQQALCIQIRDWLKAQGMEGLNLDFENLSSKDYSKLAHFIEKLATLLHQDNLTLSVDIAADQLRESLPPQVTKSADFIILMAYDEHTLTSDGGPLASLGWTAEKLKQVLQYLPPNKVVLGMGDYGYDWAGDKGFAPVNYTGAMHLARTHAQQGGPEKLLQFDPESLNPHFNYTDDASGTVHQVWYLDAAALYNQSLLAKKTGLHGVAVWELGSEDPTFWSVLGSLKEEDPNVTLGKVNIPADVQYDGDGELLQVIGQPRTGLRSFILDSETGLITAENYQKLPLGSVVQRNGYHPGMVALTFDDGPSPDFTPRILDLLKQEGVKATFFIIGNNAVNFPGIVREIWASGSEIGNHTFTHPFLDGVGEAREQWELNLTQRTLQAITGHSTLLFRAPYYVDTAPVEGALDFISVANGLGYLCVGAGVDPNDWNPMVRNPKGEVVRHTGRMIADEILSQVRAGKGNCILLHDGGGNREQTIAALRTVIPELKKEGYRFVTVSELADTTREKLMPSLPENLSLLQKFCSVDLLTFRWVGKTLAGIILIAMIIGIFRILGITGLALYAHFQNRRRIWPESYTPSVTVLIPAYNESVVIKESIESVLANVYPHLEVIVIDDGSSDQTSEVVESEFGNDPRVRCIRQKNGGKASALNNGITHSSGEIIVCMDGDTLFRPDVIAKLIRNFSDPKMGAVAGNIKVGNRELFLTQMQATEYITSQNLDRLAYSVLDAVTLVPGSIGAFRREALLEVGGLTYDTLAEDFDLTCRIRQNGWKVGVEQEAIAYTEAPEDINSFFKQRSRWSFGTLQTLWKNKRSLFQHGGYGWLGMPIRIWEFFYYSVCPVLYVQGMILIGLALFTWANNTFGTNGMIRNPVHSQVYEMAIWFVLLIAVEILQGFIAFKLDGEDGKLLWTLPLQRLYYRPLIYFTLWRALYRAAAGSKSGWGILKRLHTVNAIRAEALPRESAQLS